MKQLLLAALLALGACGPRWPAPRRFYVIVRNTDSIATPVSLSWWVGSTVVAKRSAIAPAGGDVSFDLGLVDQGARPDGLELETPAWTLAWGTSDYRNAGAFRIDYPTTSSEALFPGR